MGKFNDVFLEYNMGVVQAVAVRVEGLSQFSLLSGKKEVFLPF